MKEEVKDPMPAVSEAFMAWFKRVLIPEVTGTQFSTMQPNDALKQVAFANGVLWLKAKVFQGNEQNKARDLAMTVTAPESTPKE